MKKFDKIRLLKPEPSPSCSNCHYVNKGGDDHFCRAHPPSLTIQNGSAYPPVKPEWWCGEWRAV